MTAISVYYYVVEHNLDVNLWLQYRFSDDRFIKK